MAKVFSEYDCYIPSVQKGNKKLKSLHWMKITKVTQGILWAEAQKYGETTMYDL